MEPLTKIDLGSCVRLGLVVAVYAVAQELLTLADNPEGRRILSVDREKARRAANQTCSR